MLRLVAKGQDIGKLPKIGDPARRRRGLGSFKAFCELYFPESFPLAWAPFHIEAIRRIEWALDEGGWFAFAMPRGSGKTTLCEVAAIWAALSGRSRFTAIVGASQAAAERRISNIKTQLFTNEALLEDFPGEIVPIRHLDRSTRRAEGQRYKGRPTQIEWRSQRLVFAAIPERHCLGSEAVIEAFGLTGEIRGLNHVRTDGEIVRPEMAIADDPQTRESAKSPSQSAERERIIVGDIGYLAGPAKKIAVMMPCTIIYDDDMADRLTDRKRHPEWQGERTKMLDSLPSNNELWDRYADVLFQCYDAGVDIAAATKFYEDNREAMDAGASATWAERFRPDEASAIQHAMNLLIRDRDSFFAEAQNEPLRESSDLEMLTAKIIAAQTHGFGRGEFPRACETLTAFIDVQGSVLYWLVAAWAGDFTGYIVDYGTWPDQARTYFSLSDVRKTLKRQYKGHDAEAAIFAGIRDLVEVLCGREWIRDDGAPMRIARLCCDANWGQTSTLVNQALRQSPHAAILTPSYGRGIKATQQPISLWRRSLGKRYGPEWIPTETKGKTLVGLIYDANYWKCRFHAALAMPVGSAGAISLFKAPAQTHRMIADHFDGEVPIKTTADSRTVYEWKEKPSRDNHLFDCAVGAMVAASVCGVTTKTRTLGASPSRPVRKKRKSRKIG